MYWSLQPVDPRAYDTRCPSQAERDNARLAQLLAGCVIGRHLYGASRSGPVPRKLGWRGPARGSATRLASVDGPRGRKPRRTASSRGDVSTPQKGFQVIRGCARGSQRLQKPLAASGRASRKRARLGVPAVEGALGRGRTQRLTARRAEAALAATVTEESGVKPRSPRDDSRDRGRQRQDDDLLSRPKTPRGRSAARRAP